MEQSEPALKAARGRYGLFSLVAIVMEQRARATAKPDVDPEDSLTNVASAAWHAWQRTYLPAKPPR